MHNWFWEHTQWCQLVKRLKVDGGYPVRSWTDPVLMVLKNRKSNQLNVMWYLLDQCNTLLPSKSTDQQCIVRFSLNVLMYVSSLTLFDCALNKSFHSIPVHRLRHLSTEWCCSNACLSWHYMVACLLQLLLCVQEAIRGWEFCSLSQQCFDSCCLCKTQEHMSINWEELQNLDILVSREVTLTPVWNEERTKWKSSSYLLVTSLSNVQCYWQQNCYNLVFMLPKNTSGLKVCNFVTVTGKWTV
jgi:hypothetical protein